MLSLLPSVPAPGVSEGYKGQCTVGSTLPLPSFVIIGKPLSFSGPQSVFLLVNKWTAVGWTRNILEPLAV